MLTSREIGWIAGFLEGEGCFRFQPNPRRGGGTLLVVADQKQRFPLDRLVVLLGGTIYQHKRGIFFWHLRGRAAAAVMMTLYSQMSPRRKEQIVRALEPWKKIRPWRYLRTCKFGHAFTPENTLAWSNGIEGTMVKRCRTCEEQRRDERRRRRVLIRASEDWT